MYTNYKIIVNPSYTSIIKVGLIFTPQNDVLQFFFSNINIKNISKLLSNVLASSGYSEEIASLLFFDEMDWEDKEGLEIKQGEVYIYHQVFGETILSASLFNQIIYDYGTKLIAVHDEILSHIQKQNLKTLLSRVYAVSNLML